MTCCFAVCCPLLWSSLGQLSIVRRITWVKNNMSTGSSKRQNAVCKSISLWTLSLSIPVDALYTAQWWLTIHCLATRYSENPAFWYHTIPPYSNCYIFCFFFSLMAISLNSLGDFNYQQRPSLSEDLCIKDNSKDSPRSTKIQCLMVLDSTVTKGFQSISLQGFFHQYYLPQTKTEDKYHVSCHGLSCYLLTLQQEIRSLQNIPHTMRDCG